MKYYDILDHGYLEYVEHWGSDESIIEAARMSTGKGFLGWDPGPCPDCSGTGFVMSMVTMWIKDPERVEVALGKVLLVGGRKTQESKPIPCHTCSGKGVLAGDTKLLNYLYTNKHSTPFEMAGIIIELQAPIMVFREWHRHRTQSYSEMSARYTPLPDVNYLPTVERCLSVSGTNKQAGAVKGSDSVTHESALEWLEELNGVYDLAETVYQRGLQRGIPKEIARLPVPVGRYSRMRASANLRNWLAFLTLRMDEKAQWEIRQYANAVGDIIKETYPKTWDLFTLGRT
jgi:thymidylate synthase (FAD)